MTTPEVLRLDGVDVVRDSRPILSGVDLTIHAGEHWALIGPNGAGKSTILSLCGAVQHPTRGAVHVLGRQLGRVEIRRLRESIGHVNPRHPLRSPLTVRDVVLTGVTGTTELMMRRDVSPETAARAEHLIETLGLGDLRGATWPTLSQGERGRALIDTIDALHRTKPDLATVLVTHHLEELPETTTHAVLIRKGRLVAAGDARDVLTTDLVSDAFDYPILVEHHDGRWNARAADKRYARSVLS